MDRRINTYSFLGNPISYTTLDLAQTLSLWLKAKYETNKDLEYIMAVVWNEKSGNDYFDTIQLDRLPTHKNSYYQGKLIFPLGLMALETVKDIKVNGWGKGLVGMIVEALKACQAILIEENKGSK